MKLPLSWLREFLPGLPEKDEVVRALNELGLVVEGVETSGFDQPSVIVAEVRRIRPIEGLDKVRLVDVAISEPPSDDAVVEVACGAWNFAVGDRVPFAQVGTVMPSGMEIGRRKMRGVVSNGMLCSVRELNLGDEHDGIWVLPPATRLGVAVQDALDVAADSVIEIAVEANRPDAHGMVGVARDLAAKLVLELVMPSAPPVAGAVPVAADPTGTIDPDAHDLCTRLTTTVICGVSVGPSPAWMQRRLTAAGMRPISNLVDVSNYVMLELGIPNHAFDRTKLVGGRIGVRWARPGEQLETLDGVVRTLSRIEGPEGGRDGVIVDGADRGMGVAAIMGGALSEVDDHTSELLVEIAHWVPMAIARSSKRLNLRSEASARFEKGTDPETIDLAIARYLALVRETCPDATAVTYHDVRPGGPATTRRARVRTARANLLLGTALSDAEVVSLLCALKFSAQIIGDGVIEADVPSWRPDVETDPVVAEANLIEEIGRLYGYDRIARVRPRSPLVGRLSPDLTDRRRIRRFIASQGVDEAQTFPALVPADVERCAIPEDWTVTIANPMLESVLRPSLMPGLLKAAAHNASHRNAAVRLFEIGHVFSPPRLAAQVVPYEREHVGVLLGGPGDGAEAAVRLWHAIVELVGTVPEAVGLRADDDIVGMHPTRSARIIGTGTMVPFGAVGEVDPQIAAAWRIDGRLGWLWFDLENLLHLPRRSIEMQPFSRFPSSDVDLAFVVEDGVAAADVHDALVRSGDLVESVALFDRYRGPGVAECARSLAYRVRFVAPDRTLTEAELADARAAAIQAVVTATGATLRA
jgi:phenylalanyl-tRNA synthetase beta chain